MRRIEGLRSLVHDSIDAISSLVQETQTRSAKRTVDAIGALSPLGEPARAVELGRAAIAGLVFDAIRGVNRGVERIGDQAVHALTLGAEQLEIDGAALGLPAQLLGKLVPTIDALEAGLNAVVGDFLAARGNGLAIELGLYEGAERVELEAASLRRRFPAGTEKLAIFVHGLGCTEAAFRFRARELYADESVCYGSQLARDLGFTPLYVRYNTGRHISDNGRALAALLDELVTTYPRPVAQIALIGHSMGGLVSRSAAHYGALAQAAWTQKLSHVICIGSPHLGAPLEKASNLLAGMLGMFETAGTQVPARVLNARSAGIKDLRFGYVTDEEWTDKDPDLLLRDGRGDVSLVEHASYAFVAANFARDADSPLGQLLGDLLVRVPSGSGRADQETRHVRFHVGEVLYGLHHMALLNHPAVYEVLRRLLASPQPELAALAEALDA
jgi:pimeloyl-ACP methyl ester carboxylesterase